MKLSELKQDIDRLVYLPYTDEDRDVVITLSDPSVGARSFVDVRMVVPGIDWEHHQIRIEPADKIIRYSKDRDTPMLAHIMKEYSKADNKTYISCHCPRCGHSLRKEAKYCDSCGQAVTIDMNKNVYECTRC